MRPLLALLLLSVLQIPAFAQKTTALYYSGSLESYVTQGRTGTVIVDDEYTINTGVGSSSGKQFVYFNLSKFLSNERWELRLEMPKGLPLASGKYEDARECYLSNSTGPGMDFSMRGTHSRPLSGWFTVLEIAVSDGKLVSLAVDLMQYDRMALASWSYGSIRYNSSIPIHTLPDKPKQPLSVACTDEGPSVIMTGYSNMTWCIAGGGVEPYTWAVKNLPAGISFSVNSYETHEASFLGNPESLGPYDYTVTVTDSENNQASKRFTGTSIHPKCVPLGIDQSNPYSYYAGPSGFFSELIPLDFISSGCPWTLTSDVPGITFSEESGTTYGSIDVRFYAGQNTGSAPIVGNIYLSEAGKVIQSYPVTINSSSCGYSINPGSGSFTAQGGSGTFTVTGNPQECHPFRMDYSQWLNLKDGVYYYEVPPNAGASQVGAFQFGNYYSGAVAASFTWEQEAGDGSLVMNCYKPGPGKIGAPVAGCVAAGGTLPYVWTIVDGNSPAIARETSSDTTRIMLNNAQTEGDYQFTVKVADSTYPTPRTARYTVAGTIIPPDPYFRCSLRKGPNEKGKSYTTVCSPINGTLPYRWTLSDGNLPAGLSLTTQSNGSAMISGIPSSTGDYIYTLQLTDSADPNPRVVIQNFRGTIDPPDGPLSQFRLGCTNTREYFDVGFPATPLACSVAGGMPPYKWSVHQGNLPTGMFLSSTTGSSSTIEGLPTERAYSGYFESYIKVSDSSSDPRVAILDLQLHAQGPEDFSCTLATGKVGQSYYSYCDGLPLDAWISDGQLPPGLALASEGISGVPTTPGTYIFEISAQLGIYPTPTNTYTIEITSVPASITIRTNPDGRSFSADGTVYSSPHTFSWLIGSQHTISLGTQQGGEGTRYVFANWSDGGAWSHAIIVPSSSATYTANLALQYRLATSVSPQSGGSISASPRSADGYYAAGSSVQLTASPNNRYSFAGWSGSATGTTNPKTITLAAPGSVSATFELVVGTRPPRSQPLDSRRIRKGRNQNGPRD
jgi:hypothetical protein